MIAAMPDKHCESVHIHALASGTVLRSFKTRTVLGHGGFGITYLVNEFQNERLVAIKEYQPAELATRIPHSVVKVRTAADQKVSTAASLYSSKRRGGSIRFQ